MSNKKVKFCRRCDIRIFKPGDVGKMITSTYNTEMYPLHQENINTNIDGFCPDCAKVGEQKPSERIQKLFQHAENRSNQMNLTNAPLTDAGNLVTTNRDGQFIPNISAIKIQLAKENLQYVP